MIINLSYFFLVCLSSVGYGLLLQNKTNIKNKEFYNYGVLGISGLFILNIISYTISFSGISYNLFNLFLIFFGICIFYSRFFKINSKKLYVYFTFFILIYIGILIGKPHDDFHYYHFPYIHYIINTDFIYGIGHLNHGFRTPSSIFYLNSVFYNPLIGYGTFHYGAALYFLFANIYLYEKLNFYLNTSKKNFSVYSICVLIFINIFFYRIGEHGTDRSAQILSLIFIFELFILFNLKANIENRLKILIILLGIIISLKAFYILFLIFGIAVMIYLYFDLSKKIIEIFKIIFLNIPFLLLSVIISNILIINFINTGCLLYPISLTCFDGLPWSLGSIEAIRMNDWYELWSKGGATPNMRVNNPEEYLISFNWIPNWIDIYFFTKVSDFLGGVALLVIIVFFTLRLRFSFLDIKLKLLLLTISILILEWFINHPALRYGGYSLLSSVFFLFLSSLRFKENSSKKIFKKSLNFLIIVSLGIFFARNIDRINKEKNLYGYKPLNNPYYTYGVHDLRIMKKINSLKNEMPCNKNCNDDEFRIGLLNDKKYYISRLK
jgi:hypothetical protein